MIQMQLEMQQINIKRFTSYQKFSCIQIIIVLVISSKFYFNTIQNRTSNLFTFTRLQMWPLCVHLSFYRMIREYSMPDNQTGEEGRRGRVHPLRLEYRGQVPARH